MANDINTCVLIGRLTRDPDYKMIGSSAVVNFSIANNRIFMQNNEKKEEVNYF
ncbi:MAG: single-stranded DNA-binding protein, partial [Leptospiraceae bacterium]|nr:single-stranded DNA-binding protein [Leptospiraceae bacterium]